MCDNRSTLFSKFPQDGNEVEFLKFSVQKTCRISRLEKDLWEKELKL